MNAIMDDRFRATSLIGSIELKRMDRETPNKGEISRKSFAVHSIALDKTTVEQYS